MCWWLYSRTHLPVCVYHEVLAAQLALQGRQVGVELLIWHVLRLLCLPQQVEVAQVKQVQVLVAQLVGPATVQQQNSEKHCQRQSNCMDSGSQTENSRQQQNKEGKKKKRRGRTSKEPGCCNGPRNAQCEQ